MRTNVGQDWILLRCSVVDSILRFGAYQAVTLPFYLRHASCFYTTLACHAVYLVLPFIVHCYKIGFRKRSLLNCGYAN